MGLGRSVVAEHVLDIVSRLLDVGLRELFVWEDPMEMRSAVARDAVPTPLKLRVGLGAGHSLL